MKHNTKSLPGHNKIQTREMNPEHKLDELCKVIITELAHEIK